MHNLVLATGNRDKEREIRSILSGLPVKLSSLWDYPSIPPIIEDGTSLKENALKKARTVHRLTGEWCIADDTGLFVDILNGAPGVHSAIFAGENSTYRQNREKLLMMLDGTHLEKRTARFVCCIALCWADKSEIFEGIVEGYIAEKEAGKGGFGYDSIFALSDTGMTFAEMTSLDKNNLSHRAIALRKLRVRLEELVG
ncbi:RdgB/HAM1 family non-canonical purine NTP pyrophosphatase [candidate division WOR-3 bacterium]|nr:RdgB/HAM1 family non-canonical purine NTP pyrophosphatase [candidate division WOR-3 bacterium]